MEDLWALGVCSKVVGVEKSSIHIHSRGFSAEHLLAVLQTANCTVPWSSQLPGGPASGEGLGSAPLSDHLSDLEHAGCW